MKNLLSILLEADWITKNSEDRKKLAGLRRDRRKQIFKLMKDAPTAKRLLGVENRRALARAGWSTENGKLKERKAPDYDYASHSTDKSGKTWAVARTSGQTDWYRKQVDHEVRMKKAMETQPLTVPKRDEKKEVRTITVRPQPLRPVEKPTDGPEMAVKVDKTKKISGRKAPRKTAKKVEKKKPRLKPKKRV